MVALNSYLGGERQKLRTEVKRLNALFRAQGNLLDDVVARDRGEQP